MNIKLPPEKIKDILTHDLIVPKDFNKKFQKMSNKSLDKYLAYYYNVLELIGGKELLLITELIDCITNAKENILNKPLRK